MRAAHLSLAAGLLLSACLIAPKPSPADYGAAMRRQRAELSLPTSFAEPLDRRLAAFDSLPALATPRHANARSDLNGASAASFARGDQDKQDRQTPRLNRKGDWTRDAEICADCHEEENESILGGVHAAVPTAHGLDNCETCHGPGALHTEENEASQITQPAKLSITEQRKLCGRCHADQLEDHGGPLAELLGSGRSCTSCHKVHELRKDVPGASETRKFGRLSDLLRAAKPVGMSKCLECHGDKAKSLTGKTHEELLHAAKDLDAESAKLVAAGGHKAWTAEQSCESCHGPGSLHVETRGLARLMTRPDRAADGIAACRSCHVEVDPVDFHWKGKLDDKLLSTPKGEELRCTTCHKVHAHGDPTLAKIEPAPKRKRPTSRPSRRRSQDSKSSKTKTSASDRQEPAEVFPTRFARLSTIAFGGKSNGHPGRQIDTTGDSELRNDACAKCHADAYGVLHGTVHAQLADPMIPATQGCVACHPGGAAHAASGGRAELVESQHGTSAVYQALTCNSCHAQDPETCGMALGQHARAEVGCLSCHSPAAPATTLGKKRDAHKSCAQCHADVALSFRQANGHPVGHGEFNCSSCHDPHEPLRSGPHTARKMSRTCVECHKEFRGPFVFPHHADRSRGCIACHMPHGSSNRKLLSHRRVRDNCLSCHADLPSFHDMSPGSRYLNCLDCHTQIHGSNRHRFYFR